MGTSGRIHLPNVNQPFAVPCTRSKFFSFSLLKLRLMVFMYDSGRPLLSLSKSTYCSAMAEPGEKSKLDWVQLNGKRFNKRNWFDSTGWWALWLCRTANRLATIASAGPVMHQRWSRTCTYGSCWWKSNCSGCNPLWCRSRRSVHQVARCPSNDCSSPSTGHRAIRR